MKDTYYSSYLIETQDGAGCWHDHATKHSPIDSVVCAEQLSKAGTTARVSGHDPKTGHWTVITTRDAKVVKAAAKARAEAEVLEEQGLQRELEPLPGHSSRESCCSRPIRP